MTHLRLKALLVFQVSVSALSSKRRQPFDKQAMPPNPTESPFI